MVSAVSFAHFPLFQVVCPGGLRALGVAIVRAVEHKKLATLFGHLHSIGIADFCSAIPTNGIPLGFLLRLPFSSGNGHPLQL